jgi:hypothetical protein
MLKPFKASYQLDKLALLQCHDEVDSLRAWASAASTASTGTAPTPPPPILTFPYYGKQRGNVSAWHHLGQIKGSTYDDMLQDIT